MQVKQLQTAVYHPQMDRLVEGFNQTLERMLQGLVEEDGWNWQLMLPYILFSV